MKDKIILGLAGMVIIIGGGALCKEITTINKKAVKNLCINFLLKDKH